MKRISTLLLFFALLPAGQAAAMKLDFMCISNNDPTGQSCAIGEAQFSVLVQEATNGGTDFTFYNTDPNAPADDGIDPSIHEIYFDSPVFGDDPSRLFVQNNVKVTAWSWDDGVNPSGWAVDISDPPTTLSPKDLPEGGSVGFEAEFGADSGSNSDGNGIDEDEWLTINIAPLPFDRFTMLLMGLDASIPGGGFFNLGLHAGSLVGGESESYVSKIPPIPLPASVWLFGTALLGFIGFSRRRTV